MSLDSLDHNLINDVPNPLDAVEEVLSIYQFDYRRLDSDELILSVAGQYTSYRLFLTWQHEFQALQINCLFPADLKLPPEDTLACLFMTANRGIWLGHFELTDDQQLQFRYTAVLIGQNAANSIEHLNDLFKLAVAECDRFYPALRLVTTDPGTPANILAFALQDTAGEG